MMKIESNTGDSLDVVAKTVNGEIVVTLLESNILSIPDESTYTLVSQMEKLYLGSYDSLIRDDDNYVSSLIFKTKLSKIIDRIAYDNIVCAKVTQAANLITMKYNIGDVTIVITMPSDLSTAETYEVVDAFTTCVEVFI